MSEDIRIYVADLAAYNNGKLHGVWIDATLEVKDIYAQVKAMLADSPEEDAEEYAIHDYEGFCAYSLSEYQGLESTHEIACFIAEHGEIAGELLNHFGGCLEDARRAMEENYCGLFASLDDWVEALIEETTQIPEHLRYYIDYERMAYDMEISGDVFFIETGYREVHAFWSR